MRRALSRHATASARKRATNVSLSSELLDEAKRLGVNISRACERGLVEQIAEARAKRWLEENGEAIVSSNEFVERHGLPLDQYRQF